MRISTVQEAAPQLAFYQVHQDHREKKVYGSQASAQGYGGEGS